MFYISINFRLTDRKIYRNLRILSSLFFFIHMFVYVVVINLFEIIGIDLRSNCSAFVVTVFITTIVLLLIMRLSKLEKFAWLKILYS